MPRTPVFQQMERTECGAACLGSVLAYHGRWIGLAALRIDCGVSRDGSRAGNLVRAATRHGLLAEGARLTAEAARTLPTPFIAFWAGNHFVVVEEISAGAVRINDPAVGRRRTGWTDFARNFAGVALTLRPGPDFVREGRAPSVLAALGRRLAGQTPALIFVALASIALAVPGIIAPGFSRIFMDDVLVRRFETWLQPLLIAIVATAALQAGLTWVQQSHLLRLETRLSVGGSSALLRRMLGLPLAFFAQRSPSELAVRATQPEALAQLLAGALGTAVMALPTVAIFAAVMFAFDPVLGALCVAVAGLNLAAVWLVARALGERNQAVMIQQTRTTPPPPAGCA